MSLPEELKNAIDKEIEGHSLNALADARKGLTERYRQPVRAAQLMATNQDRLSYLATRMPATYGVVQRVLSMLPNDASIESALDLGAGPGTASWAIAAVFPNIARLALVERDRDLIDIGKRLAESHSLEAVYKAQWKAQDLVEATAFEESDLVILSYSIGELSPLQAEEVALRAWQATRKFLVMVEPGTPTGFAMVRSLRAKLIEKGAHMIAPCPHTHACPMPQGDWCHFSERIERSSTHRQVKGAALGYEDEKFSYVILSKQAYSLPSARILRHPDRHSGHINFSLCTVEGLKAATVSKRHKELYRQARKADWGDTLPL